MNSKDTVNKAYGSIPKEVSVSFDFTLLTPYKFILQVWKKVTTSWRKPM